MWSSPKETPIGPDGVERGVLLVVSSPSGAGKTTLCKQIVADFSDRLRFSVSYTTRERRQREQDGVDYHFIERQRFEQMAEDGLFAEWAEVHGNLYGTPMQAVTQNLEIGQDVLLDVDYQGGRGLRKAFPDEAITVFVLPPSFAELARRLRGRRTESTPTVERRLAKAREELSHYHEYHYLVVNDDLTSAHSELRAIYLSARCRWRYRRRYAERLIAEAVDCRSG